MVHEYVLYVTFVASKIVLRHPKRDALKNVSTPTISEFYKILRASWISLDDSNGAIRFVIQDLGNKFRIFNRNYNLITKFTILPFFHKLKFLGSYRNGPSCHRADPSCRPVSPSCLPIMLAHSASPSCQPILLAHSANPSC